MSEIVEVPESLYLELEAKAKMKGMTVTDYVSSLLPTTLKDGKSQSR